MSDRTDIGFRAVCHCGWRSDELFPSFEDADAAVDQHVKEREGDGWEVEYRGVLS